jgi:hypothetical protein
MLEKRAEIRTKRKVSIEYLESIIVESERDLAAARKRLRGQRRLEKKSA